MAATSSKLEEKWTALLPKCTVGKFSTVTPGWPVALVGKGDEVSSILEKLARKPEWLFVDGGALHPKVTQLLRSKWFFKLWGEFGAITVWSSRAEKGHEPRKYLVLEELAQAAEREVVRRAANAYMSVGGARFKAGVQDTDFEQTKAASSFAASPSGIWGEQEEPSAWKLRPFPEWPDEPDTDRLRLDDDELWGKEVEVFLTPAEEQERADDLRVWVEHGQRWEDSFLPDAAIRVQAFLQKNRETNEATATAAKDGRVMKFTRVPDLKVPQSDLRPGARGRQWVWTEEGVCTEQLLESVKEKVKFKPDNVEYAAMVIGFKDQRGFQQLCETGATHETTGFPWDSFACRNHQGGAEHHAAVAKMFIEKTVEEHWVSGPSEAPRRVPFAVLSCNGSEARPADDQLPLMLQDEPYDKKVRGTWDGSCPHDGSDPNSHCFLLPELNPPWVTIKEVVEGCCVLKSIGVPVVFFKLDLRRAYTQLFQQTTQHWRQGAYWNWVDDQGTMQGGFFTDGRVCWGHRQSGSIFYRTITTITVKYVIHELVRKWAPFVRCPVTRKWMDARRAAGMSPHQCMSVFLQSFLDDSWCFIASSDPLDVSSAHSIVLEAFDFLGWALSKSKFEEEGQPKAFGTIIGHEIEMEEATRSIGPAKKLRLRHDGANMLTDATWSRAKTTSWLGLAQFCRGNVVRRWNLRPVYQVANSGDGTCDIVTPSARARVSVRNVLESLDEARSLFHRPTSWTMPTMEVVEMCPNGDASQKHGYGGSLLLEETLFYFSGRWSDRLKAAKVNIAVLEAWVILMITTTWGHLFEGKKMVIRTDSAASCFCLNKLWSDSPRMALICDLWEDLQHQFSFEGLVVHCAGEENRLADICSRRKDSEMESAMLEVLNSRGVTAECERVPTAWKAGRVDIGVEEALLAST